MDSYTKERKKEIFDFLSYAQDHGHNMSQAIWDFIEKSDCTHSHGSISTMWYGKMRAEYMKNRVRIARRIYIRRTTC